MIIALSSVPRVCISSTSLWHFEFGADCPSQVSEKISIEQVLVRMAVLEVQMALSKVFQTRLEQTGVKCLN